MTAEDMEPVEITRLPQRGTSRARSADPVFVGDPGWDVKAAAGLNLGSISIWEGPAKLSSAQPERLESMWIPQYCFGARDSVKTGSSGGGGKYPFRWTCSRRGAFLR